MEELVTIINTVGFPIAMCIYTMYLMKTTLDKILEQMKDVSAKQQQMIESIKVLVDSIMRHVETMVKK